MGIHPENYTWGINGHKLNVLSLKVHTGVLLNLFIASVIQPRFQFTHQTNFILVFSWEACKVTSESEAEESPKCGGKKSGSYAGGHLGRRKQIKLEAYRALQGVSCRRPLDCPVGGKGPPHLQEQPLGEKVVVGLLKKVATPIQLMPSY